MYHLFYNCKSLEYLNLSSFNSRYLNKMEGMFFNCELLKNLDISNLYTLNYFMDVAQ